tara:strand:+ start:3168 stop:3386 length:219 start_codon:yes stop_codon:yes gene_type:complete
MKLTANDLDDLSGNELSGFISDHYNKNTPIWLAMESYESNCDDAMNEKSEHYKCMALDGAEDSFLTTLEELI